MEIACQSGSMSKFCLAPLVSSSYYSSCRYILRGFASPATSHVRQSVSTVCHAFDLKVYTSCSCFRLDLHKKHYPNVMQPYSLSEAKSAFERLLRHHLVNGWQPQTYPKPMLTRLDRLTPSMLDCGMPNPTAQYTTGAQASAPCNSQHQPADGRRSASAVRKLYRGRLTALSFDEVGEYLIDKPGPYGDTQQHLPAVRHNGSVAQTTASLDALPPGPSPSSLLSLPAPEQHAAAGTAAALAAAVTDAADSVGTDGRLAVRVTQAISQPAGPGFLDLTDSPKKSMSSQQQQHQQQQIGAAASTAATAHVDKDAAACNDRKGEAAAAPPGPLNTAMDIGTVDLSRPAGSKPGNAKHSGESLVPDTDAKRRKFSLEACKQVRFTIV